MSDPRDAALKAAAEMGTLAAKLSVVVIAAYARDDGTAMQALGSNGPGHVAKSLATALLRFKMLYQELEEAPTEASNDLSGKPSSPEPRCNCAQADPIPSGLHDVTCPLWPPELRAKPAIAAELIEHEFHGFDQQDICTVVVQHAGAMLICSKPRSRHRPTPPESER